MNVTRANEYLRAVLLEPREATDTFLLERPSRTLRLFVSYHLPYWILFSIIVIIAPHEWIHFDSEWNVSFERNFYAADWLAPLFVASAPLVLAFVVDRLQKFRGSPQPFSDQSYSNISFFLQLPVSAALFWFLIHPLAGYLLLFLSIIYCLYISVIQWSRLTGRTYYQILTDYLYSILLLMIPVIALLLIYNILLTYRILKLSL